MEPPVRDQAERSPESSSGSQAMFHVGSSNSPRVQEGPQIPQLLLGTEASAPFGIHHSQSCVEPRIWLTLSWNFQGLICNPQLVPRNQGHRNACPPHPPPLALHAPTRVARQEREGRTDRTLRPQLPTWTPALGILAGAKKKARIMAQSPLRPNASISTTATMS